MVNWECENCGIRASDLPDGVETDEFYEIVYGKEYCSGCMEGYRAGFWMTDGSEEYGWEEDDYEDDEDEGI